MLNELTNKMERKEIEQMEKVNLLEKTVNELNKKVESKQIKQLEKVVHALTRKVLWLENEVKERKNKTETEKEEIIENCFTQENSVDPDETKCTSSTPKELKEKVGKGNSKENLLACRECNYKCKKEITLNKHMLSNHSDHICKECQEKFPSFMELLKHVAKHHYKDQGETYDDKSEEDEFVKSKEINNQKDDDKSEEG